MSLEAEPTEKKKKQAPTLAGEIRRTRRDYLKSIILKKRAIGIPLSEGEKAQLAVFEQLGNE